MTAVSKEQVIKLLEQAIVKLKESPDGTTLTADASSRNVEDGVWLSGWELKFAVSVKYPPKDYIQIL